MDEIMDNDMQDKSAHTSSLTKTPASLLDEDASKMDKIMDNDMQDKSAHTSSLTKTPASLLDEDASKMDEIMDNGMQDKSTHKSFLTKTPISFLHEYASKTHSVLKYTIIHDGISENKVSFKYSVSLDSYKTNGEGSSKKEAKQVASLNLLKKMVDDGSPLLDTEFNKWNFDNYMFSSFGHDIKINIVQQLNSICLKNNLGLPDYTLVQEEGQAHAKLFTISCKVSNVIETATHKIKKQAKYLATVQMVNKLESFDTNQLRTLDMRTYNLPDSTEIMEEVVTIKSNGDKKMYMPSAKILMDSYHLSFKKDMRQCSKTLNLVVEQFSKDENLSNIKDPSKVLQDIINECKISITDITVKQEILSQNGVFMHVYNIDSVYPPINAIGVHSNENIAKYDATVNLLKMLCILYK